jgi:BirA family biotin operon repressor/biotin-[acetyl-CoA-carboxylase] ligase
MARRGALEGVVVVADEQTAGRGRRGRLWLANPRQSLLCSLVLRPRLSPQNAPLLTMLTAVALVRSIRGMGLAAAIKWPNDVMIAGRKVGGILIETEIVGDRLVYAIAGIGVNVNTPADDLAALSPQATSLAVQAGCRLSRWRLLRLLLAELAVRYTAMAQDNGQALYAEWRDLLETLGREVEVNLGERPIRGRAEDVDEGGALLVRLGDGRTVRVTFGDVA